MFPALFVAQVAVRTGYGMDHISSRRHSVGAGGWNFLAREAIPTEPFRAVQNIPDSPPGGERKKRSRHRWTWGGVRGGVAWSSEEDVEEKRGGEIKQPERAIRRPPVL